MFPKALMLPKDAISMVWSSTRWHRSTL